MNRKEKKKVYIYIDREDVRQFSFEKKGVR